jgi:hypothetical protein
MISEQISNDIIARYAEVNATQLSVDDLLQLADSTTTARANDEVLVDFAARNRERLTPRDLARLAKAAERLDARTLILDGKAEVGAWQAIHLGPTVYK